jgi:RNA polymerase sigma factor (sigma-70 family)
MHRPAALVSFSGPTATTEDFLDTYIRTGSQEAFTQIVHRHGRAVLVGCVRVLGNVADAEDAAQAVFLALARHPERARGNPQGWLHKVARDKAIEMFRCRIARRRNEQWAAELATRGAGSFDSDPADTQKELLAAVKRLPTRLREPVQLCYLQGRGQQEAARVVGCHQSSLSRRLMEGLGRLRSTLLRRGVVAGAAGLVVWLKTKAGMATAAVLVLTAAITVPLAVQPEEREIGAYDVKFVGMTDNGLANYSATLVYGVPGGKLQSGTFGNAFGKSSATGNYPTLKQVHDYFHWDASYQTIYFTDLNPVANAYAANPTRANYNAWRVALQKMNDFSNMHPVPRY